MRISRNMIYQFLGVGRYLTILLGLLAFGYFGHQTHWTFIGDAHGATSHSEAHAAIVDHQPVAHGTAVQFPSSESVQKSGISTAPAQRRTLQERVQAMGVITYDQRSTAQLSSRVSGTVWRATKQPGDTVKKGDTLLIIDAVEVGRV